MPNDAALADRVAFKLLKPFTKRIAELDVRLGDVKANLKSNGRHQLGERQLTQLCAEIEQYRRALSLELLGTDDAVRHANSSLGTVTALDAILEQALLATPRSEN
ncbi:MAG TPA: hypothetical protein VG757_01825 [Devosia sp.]|nr:hypothetical protein [Devosia sp.]